MGCCCSSKRDPDRRDLLGKNLGTRTWRTYNSTTECNINSLNGSSTAKYGSNNSAVNRHVMSEQDVLNEITNKTLLSLIDIVTVTDQPGVQEDCYVLTEKMKVYKILLSNMKTMPIITSDLPTPRTDNLEKVTSDDFQMTKAETNFIKICTHILVQSFSTDFNVEDWGSLTTGLSQGSFEHAIDDRLSGNMDSSY
ncbi:uncharacterized protein LOC126318609 [Schistocerca gregaria]|uniref:uncharacterized protein LOC126318609 n=1 Tax=Schistocerca gregaria TaxID=7010 RepID=UPI00211EC826|nr:uncharacterized protein LOC126318609 [Schistocerca gregaria]